MQKIKNMKIFLSDFDGTLVNQDVLDVVCEITNSREESDRINTEYKGQGILPLQMRVDLLKGVSISQINKKLQENDYLSPEAVNLFKQLKKMGYITVIHTGNIMPIMQYYKKKLNADYVICTSPEIVNNKIGPLTSTLFGKGNSKQEGCQLLMKELGQFNEIVSVGDALSDKPIFEMSTTSFAINPKNGVENYASHKIDSLSEIIDYLRGLNEENI